MLGCRPVAAAVDDDAVPRCDAARLPRAELPPPAPATLEPKSAVPATRWSRDPRDVWPANRFRAVPVARATPPPRPWTVAAEDVDADEEAPPPRDDGGLCCC